MEPADSDADVQGLAKKLDEIQVAHRVLNKPELAEKLTELVDTMDKRNLPPSAQLFLLSQGAHSIREVHLMDQKLLDAVRDGVRLNFSVRCVEEFVRFCREGDHEYDYPPWAPGDPGYCSMPQNRPEERSLPEPSPSPSPSPSPQPQLQPLSVPPIPKPRRPSVQSADPQPVKKKSGDFLNMLLFPEKHTKNKTHGGHKRQLNSSS